MKFIRAKRVNSTVLLYVYTSTPPRQYQYVPKETVRHQASCEEVYTYVHPVSLAARYRGCVSIFPVDTWQDGGTPVRTQLPLRLCWAITMHKSQDQTLDKAVIDLGPKEACTGLTFVCLSRAKRLVDLMVEPISFDRIGNLGNSSRMKATPLEEVRLVELAQSTRVRYTDMGVFSAVAANQ